MEQCTLVQNTSTLPVFNFKTNNRLKSFDINENDLHLIIKNLNTNKVHGWNDIVMGEVNSLTTKVTF